MVASHPFTPVQMGRDHMPEIISVFPAKCLVLIQPCAHGTPGLKCIEFGPQLLNAIVEQAHSIIYILQQYSSLT